MSIALPWTYARLATIFAAVYGCMYAGWTATSGLNDLVLAMTC
jgi:hypothetical protein